MRQFDAYDHPVAAVRGATPYLIVLSSHHLPGLTEAVVAPLTHLRQKALSGVEVELTLDDPRFVLVTMDIASIASHRLRRKVGSIAGYEDEIRRALDRLFTGF